MSQTPYAASSASSTSNYTDYVYVSVTGLRLKKPWHFFRFVLLAVPSKAQAERSDGNLLTKVRYIKGTHHTLTAWKSKAHMMGFKNKGAHRKAIRLFNKIAEGETYGFQASAIPSWDEALQQLEKHGKPYAS